MSKLQAKASDLAKAWSLVRSSDTRQMTVRVPVETFAKILALEEMFPHRTRNEMVADLLATGLDDFVSSLPYDEVKGEYLGFSDEANEPVYELRSYGPKVDFLRDVDRFLSDLSKSETKPSVSLIDSKGSDEAKDLAE